MGRAEAGDAQFSDAGLDRWIVTNYGYECTWTLLPLIDEERGSDVVATFPNFRIVYNDGDEQVGIAIMIKLDSESEEESEEESETETESEEEEIQGEKGRIILEEDLHNFAHVYNDNGIEIEIAGQRGTYYMISEGDPEEGYFHYTIPAPEGGHFYLTNMIDRAAGEPPAGTAFNLDPNIGRVGRIELVDDPDYPAGSGAKAVKVWPYVHDDWPENHPLEPEYPE
jgi:hypothetical protein